MKAYTAPRRIRVLQVVGNGIVGGMETVVMRLLERLPRERFEVMALCPYEGAFTTRLRAMGIDCMAVPMPDEPSWSAIQTVAALVQSAGIDVLHAHLTNAHLLAGLVGSVTGKPVLSTLHGRQLNLVDLEVHRATGSHLCTVCRHSQLHALGLGARRARVSCIPNGVDTTVFKPAAAVSAATVQGAGPAARADRRDIPDSLDSLDSMDSPDAPRGPVVGFVGRLSPEKGPEVFVRAALALRQRLPNARFVLIGDGPLRPAVLKLLSSAAKPARRGRAVGGSGAAAAGVAAAATAAAAAAASGAASTSAPGIFWQGLRDDMPAAYRELDMLVSTSNSEAMPLAIMEAMASGLPVVATRVGGVPDLVEHGRTGWLVEPGNVDGIAHCIEQLANAPAEARRMGAQGRARMVAGFDLSLSVAATARLLERLATQHAGARSSNKQGGAADATTAHTALPAVMPAPAVAAVSSAAAAVAAVTPPPAAPAMAAAHAPPHAPTHAPAHVPTHAPVAAAPKVAPILPAKLPAKPVVAAMARANGA